MASETSLDESDAQPPVQVEASVVPEVTGGYYESRTRSATIVVKGLQDTPEDQAVGLLQNTLFDALWYYGEAQLHLLCSSAEVPHNKIRDRDPEIKEKARAAFGRDFPRYDIREVGIENDPKFGDFRIGISIEPDIGEITFALHPGEVAPGGVSRVVRQVSNQLIINKHPHKIEFGPAEL